MAAPSSRGRMLALAVLLVAAGCGPSGPTPVPIQGQVTFGDQPVTNGTIIFTPVDGTAGPSTGGNVTDGHYTVPSEKGPYAGGTYRVEVTALRKNGKTVPNMFDSTGRPAELSDQFLPETYNTKSILKVTLPPRSGRVRLDIPLATAGTAIELVPR
ncbi:hypothetical protein [Fimbriiglobus ruber]|uniref:Carboxypeptidase regulatory-like domain-containing protein n=1 Tax=Fimbriiglobus ruber TaxID=1908690 RepID=A0A225EA36_9BACT|nr:hypothetical protein [Fimbriiglobus ruber]OWK45425.1 hypothetical protein FRUB_01756 [Fimbriiglobus ruber]